MKIKNISCTQFAGVRDRNISFEDGINTVYGKNESGKSTLVNLISRTLFQNVRIDRRSDKEFQDLYFPGARKGDSFVGDSADGKIIFETERGTYTLSKEWGSEPRCIFSTPDGVIRDQKTVKDSLKAALLYGEGVYTMLFSSQRNTDISLQTILDATKKNNIKQDIVDAVSQAFVESDGITVDAIEQAIDTKIDEIAGKHWDSNREIPVRRADGSRWSNVRGEILKAYYDLEDAKAVVEKISRLETKADRACNDYTVKNLELQIADEAYQKFDKFAGRLTAQSQREKNIGHLEEKLQKMTKDLSDWRNAETLEKAEILQTEKAYRELMDKYESAKRIVDELNDLDNDVLNIPCPSDDEIVQVENSQHDVVGLENKLCEVNLNAIIKMIGDNTVEVRALRTGENIDIKNENISITEAVSITVPGVMEMQLSPANVNVEEIKDKIVKKKEIVNAVFEKYNVHTVMELRQLAKKIADSKTKADAGNSRLSILLGDTTSFEELEAAAKAITDDVRTKDEIEREITEICGDSDIAGYVISMRTKIQSYIDEYGSINVLKDQVYALETELKKEKKSASAIDDIPVEYRNITDPEDYLESLKKDLELKREIRENAHTVKTVSTRDLEKYRETVSDNPAAEVEKAEKIFEEKKTLLVHWKHIADVFKAQKENVHDNPMQDIADRFTHYLSVISEGKVSSEFPDTDKLNMNIYSDNRLLDYGKLSEGTKDTVSLAFRLAVLDHLFPEGGGVIVFDDPFTDMDAERAAQSCELIKECATRHQVIFLTCREEYLDMLGGNRILMEEIV